MTARRTARDLRVMRSIRCTGDRPGLPDPAHAVRRSRPSRPSGIAGRTRGDGEKEHEIHAGERRGDSLRVTEQEGQGFHPRPMGRTNLGQDTHTTTAMCVANQVGHRIHPALGVPI